MPERTLVVLRHAKAAWPDGVPDQQRPLASRGRADASAVGRWLREHLVPVDVVVCSPALRVEQTWELVAAELGYPPELRVDPRMYGGGVDDLLDLIRQLPDTATTALLVGHNPEVSGLTSELSGEDVDLSTAAIALLSASQPWSAAGEGWARLTRTVTAHGAQGG